MTIPLALFLTVGLFLAGGITAGRGAVGGDSRTVQAVAPPLESEQPLGALGMLAEIKRKVAPLEKDLAAALRDQNWAEAEKVCQRMIEAAPFYPNGHYNLACALARQGRKEPAFKALETAIEKGFNNADHIRNDADLAKLAGDKRFDELIEQARGATGLKPQREIAPAVPTNGIAWVSDANTLPGRGGLFQAAFKVDTAEAAGRDIATLKDETGDLLRKWWQEGTAAGNAGDLYDNRDGDHSNLNRKLFPQLTFIEYAPEARELKLHWGLAEQLVLNGGVVLGNASVAATSSPFWRSMSRAAYTHARPLGLHQLHYFGNQLYVYPCHHDHSPGHNGKLPNDEKGAHGDVFPANTPYLITSQGSSGSDRAFLEAVAATLAAFRPEVKKFLVQKGALMPAVQMILRASGKDVQQPEDYLTGMAHPTVFDGSKLDRVKMAQMAHGMTEDKVPPVVLLKVIEEDRPIPGRDFFYPAKNEELFTTACAVARVMRSTQYRRRMVVSAEASRDLNGLPLKFHWKVLRGDEKAIRLEPLNAESSRVELSVPWHPRRPVRPGSDLESNRIDLGAFVHNGVHHSAPAFITWYCPDNEQREYDDHERIRSVTYSGANGKGNYADPMVALPRNWKDEYHYDDSGKLTGWTRHREGKPEQFDAEGRLIVSRDAQGRPEKTREVRYAIKQRGPNQLPVVEPVVE